MVTLSVVLCKSNKGGMREVTKLNDESRGEEVCKRSRSKPCSKLLFGDVPDSSVVSLVIVEIGSNGNALPSTSGELDSS